MQMLKGRQERELAEFEAANRPTQFGAGTTTVEEPITERGLFGGEKDTGESRSVETPFIFNKNTGEIVGQTDQGDQSYGLSAETASRFGFSDVQALIAALKKSNAGLNDQQLIQQAIAEGYIVPA